MSTIIKNVIAWRLNIAWAVMFSFNALISAFLVAVVNIDFPALDAWKKILLFLGVFLNWSNTMMALFKQAEKKLSSGKLLIDDTDTDPETTKSP